MGNQINLLTDKVNQLEKDMVVKMAGVAEAAAERAMGQRMGPNHFPQLSSSSSAPGNTSGASAAGSSASQNPMSGLSFAAAASNGVLALPQPPPPPVNQGANRREADYWLCRRSLRLWPILGPDLTTAVRTFLVARLGMDADYIGSINLTASKYRTPRAKTTDEVLVVFDTYENRDMVRAAAPALGGRGNTGVRIHVPRHLQEGFKILDRLCYAMKADSKNLRRSVKFDDDNLTIFADVRLDDGEPWKRIYIDEAKEALASYPTQSGSGGPVAMSSADISAVLARAAAKAAAAAASASASPSGSSSQQPGPSGQSGASGPGGASS